MPQQFNNEANPEVHRLTTGPEIADALDRVDAFVSGIGTGGTITGVGMVLKERFPDVQIIAVEPTDSPVLSGGKPGPAKNSRNRSWLRPESARHGHLQRNHPSDRMIKLMKLARRAAREEGILGGVSSGAAIFAALQVAEKLGKGKTVVAVLPSNGERYLSTPLYQFED